MNIIAKLWGIYSIVVFGITTLIAIGLIYIWKSNTLLFRKFWALSQTYLIGFSIEVIGAPDPKAGLLIINHQSLIDIVSLEATFSGDLCWIAKKEIKDIPIFGHMITAPEMIDIDRNDRRSMIKMLKSAKSKADCGRIIAIFPEGTRGDGTKLLKFQNGAKILAEKLNLKVQPILILGAKHVFDSKNLTSHKGTVYIIYLDAIDPTQNTMWYESLFQTMQEKLIFKSAKYLQE